VGEASLLGVQEGQEVKVGVFYAKLVEMIKFVSKGGPCFLILDGLSDMFAANENDRQIANSCIKTVLGSLVKNLNCTILVIAHPSKTSEKSKVYDSGSTGWRNAVRSMIVLTPHENVNLIDNRILCQTKSNYGRRIDPISLKWERGRLISEDVDSIVDEVKEKNLEILIKVIASMCQKKVPTPLGLHHNKQPNLYQLEIKGVSGVAMDRLTKKKLINELISDGVVVKVRDRVKKSENGLWPSILLGKEG
jgi:RecA-family ATPase